MNKKILILAALAVMLFAACGDGSYTPKPEAYLRINMPEHDYWLVDTLPMGDEYLTLPFIFEANDSAELKLKRPRQVATVSASGVKYEKLPPSKFNEVWLDINYPQWNGVVFLTYRRMLSPDSLRGQVDMSYRLLEQHFNFSSGVEEQQFENPENRVFATTYHIKGRNVASTYQFWATDSVKHFLCGALYINESPNNDSLAPVLDYLQQDVDHLIETLRWK